MSRIGKKPIQIPEGVTCEITGNTVVVKGPKGELSVTLPSNIIIKKEDNIVTFDNTQDTKPGRSAWGMSRAIVSNMVEGVTKGYEKTLELVGVGYRAMQNGNGLTINIGYSKPVQFVPPEGVAVKVDEAGLILVSGIDKQLVGLVAADIRSIRSPEPYKGKGIKYQNEYIRRKVGKSGKV